MGRYLFSGLIVLVSVSIAQGNPYYVDASAPTGGHGLSWDSAFRALDDALTVAQQVSPDPTEIRVAQGVYLPTVQTSPGVSGSASFRLFSGLSLRGGYAGIAADDPDTRDPSTYVTVLDGDLNQDDGIEFTHFGDNVTTLLTILPSTSELELDGITFRGAQNLIDTSDSDTSFTDCIITAIKAESPGYAMRVNRGSLAFATCVLDACIPPQSPGSSASLIRVVGGAQLNLSHTTISNNEGQIALDNGDVYAIHCAFSNNWGDFGGAIDVEEGSHATIVESDFDGNAAYGGGAIWNSHGTLVVHDCTFESNSASSYSGGAIESSNVMVLTSSHFIDNSSGEHNSTYRHYGGAVYCRDSVYIGDCSFSANYGTDNGAVEIDFADGAYVTSCDFADNSADDGSGALRIDDSEAVIVRDCVFEDNRVPYYWTTTGSALTTTNATVDVIGCDFLSNGAGYAGTVPAYLRGSYFGRGRLADCRFEGNQGGGVGGVLLERVDLEDCTFVGNEGGGVGAISATNSNIINCRVLGNAEVDGTTRNGLTGYPIGGVSLSSDTAMVNCLISGNVGYRVGGVLCSEPGTQLVNCTIVENHASDPDIGANGVFVRQGRPEMTNCIFSNGDRDIDGVGAFMRSSLIAALPSSFDGGGNISGDPMFVDLDGPDNEIGTIDDDPRIMVSSPCGNAGYGYVNMPVETDLLGADRVQGCRIDIGASESAAIDFIDCNENGVHDDCEISNGTAADCNRNFLIDACEIADGTAVDGNANGVPDVCEMRIIRIDAAAAAGGNGDSWATAYNDLQAALAAAEMQSGHVDLWIAAGTYSPSPGSVDDRFASFIIPSNVSLYGGFSGSETDISQRDPDAHLTILTGDNLGDSENASPCCDFDYDNECDDGLCRQAVCIHNPSCCDTAWDDMCEERARQLCSGEFPSICDVFGDDVYVVVDLSNAGDDTILDGLTIRHSTGQYGVIYAGLYIYGGAPLIRDCHITANFGTGVVIDSSAPTFEDCRIDDNRRDIHYAHYSRGVEVNFFSDVTFERCDIDDNSSTGIYVWPVARITLNHCRLRGNGDGVYAAGPFAATNSLFADNLDDAMETFGEVRLDHCTVADNGGVGAYVHNDSSLAATNCIFWGHGSVYGHPESSQINTYYDAVVALQRCCIQSLDEYAGNGNIGANPRFVDPSSGDYRTRISSPCVDAGDASLSNMPSETDLAGNPRLGGCEVDMGAYEVPAGAPMSGDFNGDGAVTLSDIDLAVKRLLFPLPLGTCVGDLDGSGAFDGGDIQTLVDLILQ